MSGPCKDKATLRAEMHHGTAGVVTIHVLSGRLQVVVDDEARAVGQGS